jgi:UDP-N-acetylglucosamine transferase subunit ALG13
MTRLVDELERLIDIGAVTEEVILQTAAPAAVRNLRAVDVLPRDELSHLMGAARVVVCHGGPGTILEARAAGRVPIVVPRDPTFGEHVDDHQIRFVRWLAIRLPVRPLWDVDDLLSELQRPEMPTERGEVSSRPKVAARLVEIVEADR